MSDQGLDKIGDLRRFDRLSVGPDYGISLEFQGRVLEDAVLQNLSACGCGVKVPRSEGVGFEMGQCVDRLLLVHPALPLVPLEGTIVRVLGRANDNREGYLLLGIDFIYVSPTVECLIAQHVAKLLHSSV